MGLNIQVLKVKLRELSDIYPWHFMVFIFLAMIIPKLYQLSNVFWIGKISFEALAITEQYEFIGVTIEIVNETIPFGILALIAQNYRNRDKVISILKAGLVLHVFLSLLLMSIVILFAPQFVSTIGTPKEIVDVTKNYLILKSISLPFESVAILLLISIKAMQKGKEALYLATFSVLLNMALDMILISNFDFSLHLGITGVAIGYVISNIAYMLACLIFIIKILKINLYEFIRTAFKDNIKPIFTIGGWTGLDSLVRNVGYIGTLMVLNLIGVNEFGGYGLAMTVMWTVIIPVLALTEGTNVAIGNFYGDRKYRDIKTLTLRFLGVYVVA